MCTTAVSKLHPMLTFRTSEVIQIICKNVRFFHPAKKCMMVGWLGCLRGRFYGYVDPADAELIK